MEKKSSFYDSVMKIGHEFQGIFGVFGDAIGDALGFSAVKSDDNRDKVGEHFKEIGEGLTKTKNKLNELSGKISETKNADGSAVKVVEESIKKANEVFDKLIVELDKLAGVTKGDSGTKIGATSSDNTTAVVANKEDVQAVIAGVKEIIKAAEDSGLKIADGKDGGSPVIATNGGDVVAKQGSGIAANMGPKLADEVAKADPWAMINKIKNAKIKESGTLDAGNNDAGELATGIHASNAGAKTNADLAAAVALKAMTKNGKFSINNSTNEGGAVKAAAANAVNKVLGVLNVIISRTVASELSKVGKAVNGMQYSENTAEKSEGATK